MSIQPAVSYTHLDVYKRQDRDRATRLLNSIYLQGGLMVLRTHHAARDNQTQVGWLRGWLKRER